jgi:mannosyltransferase
MDRVLLFGLALFAAAAGVIGIHRPMLIDEANSVIISGYDLPGVFHHLRLDNNVPLYYVFLHGWIGLFGISEVATRIPSIIFYVLAILTAYVLGKEVSRDSRVGLYAAFFYAISLQAIHLAQRVRMYSLLGLLAGLSTLFFLRCFSTDRRSRRDLLIYTLVNTIGVCTHIWFVFLLVAQFASHWIWSRRSTTRLMASLAFSAVSFCILWGPSFLQQTRNGATNWMLPVDLWSLPGAVLEFYGGTKIGIPFLVGCGLLLLMRHNRPMGPRTPDGRRMKLALFVVFGLSVCLPLVVSLLKHVYWPGRYTIIALPCLAVLLAWELVAAVPARLLAGTAWVAMAAVMVGHVMMRHDMIENSNTISTYSYSDKHAAEELAKRTRPGDQLIFTGLSRASIEYYFRLFHRDRDVTLISYPAENAEHVGWDANQISEAVLSAQADAVAQRVSQAGAGKSLKIWIVVGASPVPNRILFNRMRGRFSQRDVLKLWGAFFKAVVVFDKTGGGPPSS